MSGRQGNDAEAVAGGSDEKAGNGGTKASTELSERAAGCEKTCGAENETLRAGDSTSMGLPEETEIGGDLSGDNNVKVAAGLPEWWNEGETLFL